MGTATEIVEGGVSITGLYGAAMNLAKALMSAGLPRDYQYGYRRPLPNLISTSTSIAPPISPRSRRTSSRTARRTSSGSEMNACPDEPAPCS